MNAKVENFDYKYPIQHEGHTIWRKPALFWHTLALYEKMVEEAHEADEHGNLVWKGVLGNTLRSLGLSYAYYSQVIEALAGMRCGTRIKRGSPTAESVWALHAKPTVDAYNVYMQKGRFNADGTRKTTKLEILDQRLTDLHTRVMELEAEVALLRGANGHSD